MQAWDPSLSLPYAASGCQRPTEINAVSLFVKPLTDQGLCANKTCLTLRDAANDGNFKFSGQPNTTRAMAQTSDLALWRIALANVVVEQTANTTTFSFLA